MNIKIKRLVPEAVIPAYGSVGAACFDLTSISCKIVDEGNHGYVEYDTGLAFSIPKGHVGLLYPRSSISKTGMILSNSVGVIDSDYRGSVTARFKWVRGTTMYNTGDRCCQMMVIPIEQVTFEEVQELDETERGTGGYGSTGK